MSTEYLPERNLQSSDLRRQLEKLKGDFSKIKPLLFLGSYMRVLLKFVGRPFKIVSVSNMWFIFDKDKVTMREVLEKLKDEKRVKLDFQDSSIVILVNGRNIEHLGGLEAEIRDLDQVVVASFAAGG